MPRRTIRIPDDQAGLRSRLVGTYVCSTATVAVQQKFIRSSTIAEGPRDASCQLKSCQLPRNSAETTHTTSPDEIDGMKLEV